MAANALAALAAALGSMGQSMGQNRELKRRAMLDALAEQDKEREFQFRKSQDDRNRAQADRQEERQNFDIASRIASGAGEEGIALTPELEAFFKGPSSAFVGRAPLRGGIDATPIETPQTAFFPEPSQEDTVGRDPFATPPMDAPPVTGGGRVIQAPSSERQRVAEINAANKLQIETARLAQKNQFLQFKAQLEAEKNKGLAEAREIQKAYNEGRLKISAGQLANSIQSRLDRARQIDADIANQADRLGLAEEAAAQRARMFNANQLDEFDKANQEADALQSMNPRATVTRPPAARTVPVPNPRGSNDPLDIRKR